MEQYECSVCGTNCCYYSDKKLYFSDVCPHKLCENCLLQQFGGGTAPITNNTKGVCPLCQRSLTRGNFILTEPDIDLFSFEKQIRKRVNNALNALRDNFENTPAYNDYLEEKEDAIYELVYGTDEQLKRRLENRLRELEGHGRTQAQHLQQQQQQQQQNAEARAALRVRKIKEIVKKEGNFYEIVKLKPLGKSINASDEPYTHVLERQYSSLFQSASAAAAKSGLSGSGSSNERAKPLDPLIREDQHIPRRKYINIHDFDAAGAAAGFVPAVYRERGTKELRGIMLSL